MTCSGDCNQGRSCKCERKMNTDSIWSLIYEHDGMLWSMHVLGTEESAKKHAYNLNTTDPERVDLLIPDYRRSMN